MTEKDIIIELAENELKLEELYRQYAENLPELKDFWSHISGDEMHHFKILKEFQQKEKNSDIFIDRKRFQPEAVKLVREFVEDKISEAKKTPTPSAKDSLIVAEDIETSLLEKNIFEIFESDSADLKVTLETLEKETREHLRLVKEKIRENIPNRV